MSWKVNVCCFCLPLRPGLFIWGYFALVMTYISILQMLFRIEDIFYNFKYFDPTSFVGLTLLLGISFVHLIFYIVLIAGLHKKSRGLLEVFYGYNVFIMILVLIISFLYVPVTAYRLNQLLGVGVGMYLVVCIFSLAITMCLQLYLIIVVRSLISKLKDDKDCSASVYPIEDPGCIMHIYKEKDYCDC